MSLCIYVYTGLLVKLYSYVNTIGTFVYTLYNVCMCMYYVGDSKGTTGVENSSLHLQLEKSQGIVHVSIHVRVDCTCMCCARCHVDSSFYGGNGSNIPDTRHRECPHLVFVRWT